MSERINLYNGLFVQAFVRVSAQRSNITKVRLSCKSRGLPQGHNSIIIFNLINQEIRSKGVLSWNRWHEDNDW